MAHWMENKPAKSVKIGNIYEIETPVGYFYIQYVHFDKLMGYLVRLIDGRFDYEQTDFEMLAGIPTKYMFFYALPACVKLAFCKFICNAPVPNADKKMPTSVNQMHVPKDAPAKWEIIAPDGGVRHVYQLTESQKNLPISSIPGHPIVLRRLVDGWTPTLDNERYEREHRKLV